MSEHYLIETKEVGDYRIKIFHDDCAFCPCTDWDLAALYLFEYNSRGWYSSLHDECNWKEVWGEYSNSNHSLTDSLIRLIMEHADFDKTIDAIKKGKFDNFHLIYNKSSRMWYLECYSSTLEGKWFTIIEFEPSDFKEKDWYQLSRFLGCLEQEDLMMILCDFGKDIHVQEWCTRGYSQGDYVEGVAWCTKERYTKMVSEDTKDWKDKLEKLIESEVKEIGMWMWGDVKGFVLEKKVHFTKSYKDKEREDEDDFEWEEVDRSWGYYMETEELIEDVMHEHDIKEEVA